MAPAVTAINQRLLSASLDISTFWRRLLIETADDQSDARACEIAVAAAGCSELQLDSTAAAILNRISECRAVMSSRFPKLAEQLPLRGRPIIERFEAYGPGLLRAVANYVWYNSPPKDWWPSKFEGLLVQPILGGDGEYDSQSSRFWIEAMLTDADPSVPEVLRVVYLLTCAAMDSHTRDRSGEQAVSLPWALAAVPIVLTVAAELELVRPDPLPIVAACRLWHAGDGGSADTLVRWWENLQQTPAPLPIALKALALTLAEDRSRSMPKPPVDKPPVGSNS